MTHQERREHAERLWAMSKDDCETWDLSDNDQRACAAGAAALDAQAQPAEDRATPREGLPEDVQALARAGRKLDAIRLLRNDHGLTLRMAKDAVETFLDRDRLRVDAVALRAPAEAPPAATEHRLRDVLRKLVGYDPVDAEGHCVFCAGRGHHFGGCVVLDARAALSAPKGED